MRGGQVGKIQNKLVKIGFSIPQNELETQTFGVGTKDAVQILQRKSRLSPTGTFDQETNAALESALAVAGADHPPILEGRLYFDYGLPAQNVPLRLYNKGFGDKKTLIANGHTDKEGYYTFTYNLKKEPANLEIWAVNRDEKEIALSDTKFNSEKLEIMNLVAPAEKVQPLKTEFERLTADITEEIGGLELLAEVCENHERKDLGYLHHTTGWDARLIALASKAIRNSKETGMPEDALYALYRVGMPTDPLKLAFKNSGTVGEALSKAAKSGIVHFSQKQMNDVKWAFESYSRNVFRVSKADGTLSTLSELLEVSGLNSEEKDAFESVYFAYRRDESKLWERLEEVDILKPKIASLRVLGKLAFLTLNNAKLASSLQQEIGTPEKLVELVNKDLYRKGTWVNLINSLAGNNEYELEKLIPSAYTGGKIADRLEAYAEDLSRRVRLSYPTRVIARMVETDILRLGDNHDEIKASVNTFLRNAETLGFILGETSVDAFTKKNEAAVFQDIDPNNRNSTVENVKYLHRLYQITPSDYALKVIIELGFTSASDIVAFSKSDFLYHFGSRFANRREAELVYEKAQQVNAVTYSIFTTAKQMDHTAAVYGVSGTQAKREEAKNKLKNMLKDYPTMESLFGELDFCECEHCRSVLSPAAYFVDLLRFLDMDKLVWEAFLKDWKVRHNGEEYTAKYKKAFDELKTRRPDLRHLPLTCENTNTVMPYIDIVNEILEFFVVDGHLKESSFYDTGTAETSELLAEPQNIQTTAYDLIKDACYPLILPFNLWAETVRRFTEYFGIPIWEVLSVLRKANGQDELELFAPNPPEAHPKRYYQDAIFAEYLGFTQQEYSIFTNPDFHANWYRLYGFATEPEALTELKYAKMLSKRLGISYKELVEMIHTGFINPKLHSLVILQKIGVEVNDILSYKGVSGGRPFTPQEKTVFENRLNELSKTFGFDAKLWLDTAWPNEFSKILVLSDSGSCSFNETKLQYIDGSESPDDFAMVFLKMNLFVRLSKKLGWTIGEIDRSLQVFIPNMPPSPLRLANLGEAMKTVLLYFSHLKALDEQVDIGEKSREKLLTLWSLLSTKGKQSLYSELFLKKTDLKYNPIFDDPMGNYLSKPNVYLKNHALAIQGALNLTAVDLFNILKDNSKDFNTVELNLEHVSLLYRYGMLAKGLKMSVNELITLKNLSGRNPFHPLKEGPVEKLDEDFPFIHSLRFIEIAKKVKASGFSLEDLDYLLRHRFDPVGKYRMNPVDTLDMVRKLGRELRRIIAEHSIPADSAAFDNMLRHELSLVVPNDVVDQFLGMWTGSIEYKVEKTQVSSDQKLNPNQFMNEPNIRVVYDELKEIQYLTYHGVLLEDEKKRLTKSYPSQILMDLLDKVQRKVRDFFETCNFLQDEDIKLIFTADSYSGTYTEKQERIRQKRTKLAEAFIPFLQQKLMRQFLVQSFTAIYDENPKLIQSLLSDASLLSDKDGGALIDAFAKLGEKGVDVKYYDNEQALIQHSTLSTVTTEGRPNNSVRLVFKGYLEVPAAGEYSFYMRLGKRYTRAELRFNHLQNPILKGVSESDEATELSGLVDLKADLPYEFTLDVSNLTSGEAELYVKGPELTKGGIDRLILYPASAVERVKLGRILLSKSYHFIQGLGLSERELRHFVNHAMDFDHINLSRLPTQPNADSQGRGHVLFNQFLRLADYAQLKQNLAGGTEDLISIFEQSRRTYPADVNVEQAKADLLFFLCGQLAKLMRRETSKVHELAIHFNMIARHSDLVNGEIQIEVNAFVSEKGISRLWESLQLIDKLGVPVEDIIRWATPDPDAGIVHNLRNTVKARFKPEDWLRIAQPIFDQIRKRKRDALTSFITHRDNFESQEKLYEWFLIDPGMEPVVQTSRLRLAISSVQLFIQRCLLNLEKNVHPSAINSKHWQWMKQYRNWESNRKIFLFPENWLEPEFRDDKTAPFKELEGELLQGNISSDLVEDSFFNYLKKMEEIANLEVVTTYLEEKPNNPASNILHVIARTYNDPGKYFYRRYAQQMWTPWEPVGLDIQGKHVTAIVWRERLHLFWVTFLEKSQNPNPSDTTKISYLAERPLNQLFPGMVVDYQLQWSELNQGKWSIPKASGFGNVGPVIGNGNRFNSADVFIHATKEYDPGTGEERAVKIHLGGAIDKAFRIVSKNSVPEMVERENPLEKVYNADTPLNPYYNAYQGSNSLYVTYTEHIRKEDGKAPVSKIVTKPIVNIDGYYKLLLCNTPSTILTKEAAGLVYPFFLQDNQHTFFVQPNLIETTIEKWEDVYIPPDPPDPPDDCEEFHDCPPHIKQLRSLPVIPRVPFPINETSLDENSLQANLDLLSRYEFGFQEDWLINPVTVLSFDGSLITHNGRLHFETMEIKPGFGGVMKPVEMDSENAGSHTDLLEISSGTVSIHRKADRIKGNFSANDTTQEGIALNIVSSSGMNSTVLENLNAVRHLNRAKGLFSGTRGDELSL